MALAYCPPPPDTWAVLPMEVDEQGDASTLAATTATTDFDRAASRIVPSMPGRVLEAVCVAFIEACGCRE
eukprot:10407525-Prorocentrum_lima.AAC.1